ncbi:MAG: sigma-54-dependent Fis family transcriptional regulator [Bacteroidetes bacterium]|nr:sigma-54-dependent Fis family transcriptional regulator [Bacteroidota bacterium]
MPKGKILIVDDNKSVLSALELLLFPAFGEIRTVSTPNRMQGYLEEGDVDLVVLDMNFSAGVNTGNEGLYWLKKIMEFDPELPVVMITAYGDVELAVKALKEGATDFVLKPWDNQKMLATLKSAYQLRQSRLEVSRLKQKERALKKEINRDFQPMIGTSHSMMQMQKMIAKVAKTEANVLITGENGTGKELVAREIHRLSGRKEEVMVSVDMGAVSETLFESELFGHVKGAYTDAREDRIGKIETAHNGTLFLDEIGNFTLSLQAKMLTVLQNRQIIPLGSNLPVDVNIRLICATNRDLSHMIDEGTFREDLLYRINTIHIEVPPLRERGKDIILLSEFFLKRYSDKYGKENLRINSQTQEKLLNYRWPGNVRELQHAIEKAVILSDGNVLKPESFFFKPIIASSIDQNLTVEEMEKRMISGVMKKANGNMSIAAQRLGFSRQTLYNKIKKYGI